MLSVGGTVRRVIGTNDRSREDAKRRRLEPNLGEIEKFEYHRDHGNQMRRWVAWRGYCTRLNTLYSSLFTFIEIFTTLFLSL
mgnify:CR=1 FL=1